MIEQVTGLPGSGKTLITLCRIKELAEKDNRQVYYSGIPDLKLPWIELDKGEDWHKVPPGSIVVIDEAQRVFRPRANGSSVPEHVEKLETHRHHGIDLYLITQHPLLLDSNVRRLVGRHMHTVRPFGAKFATLHEFSSVKENCDKNRNGSIEHKWVYPKKAFDWYKSAEVHTHKVRLPMRFFVLLVLPLLIGLFGWWAYKWITGSEARTSDAVKKQTGIEAKAGGSAPVRMAAKRDYFAEYQPRIVGLAYTAPVYDKVTEPVRAPYPAACIDSQKKCTCYSQQATRLPMEEGLCRQIAANGFFKEWDDKEPAKRTEAVQDAPRADKPDAVTLDHVAGVIAAPAPNKLSESPKDNGGGPSTNPRMNPTANPVL